MKKNFCKNLKLLLNLHRNLKPVHFQKMKTTRFPLYIIIVAAISAFSLTGTQDIHAREVLIPKSDSAAIKLLPGHFLLGPEYEYRDLAKRQGIVTWDVSLYGSGASHGMPFWAGANRRGLVPENLSSGGNRNITGFGNNRGGMSGLLTAGAEFAYLTKPEIVLSAGLSVAGYGVMDNWDGMLDRLYFGISWKKLHLDFGMKDRYYDYNGLSLTGGNLAYSGNARNLPGYNLSTDFIYIPYTNRIIGFKANFADYMMLDNRYIDKAKVHNESLYLKITPARRFSLTVGLEMWSQWSGTSPKYGKQPGSLNDYIRVVFGMSGGDDATKSDQINVLGNHLGRELIRLDWRADDFTVTFQHDIPFDDKSGMRFQNFPDGVNTLNFSFREKDRWVSDILVEYVNTKWQSGPHHDNTTDPEHKDEPYHIYGGRDNYFNNGEYQSGWTYYGKTIGLPLFTPMPAGEDGKVLGVCNNRLSAWHFGIRGKAARLIPYKFLFTYSRNFGKYAQSISLFDSIPQQFSLALECEVPRLGRNTPLSLGIGLYGDFGEMYQDSFGLSIRLSYAGRSVFGRR